MRAAVGYERLWKEGLHRWRYSPPAHKQAATPCMHLGQKRPQRASTTQMSVLGANLCDVIAGPMG